jgi:hypothetical protein
VIDPHWSTKSARFDVSLGNSMSGNKHENRQVSSELSGFSFLQFLPKVVRFAFLITLNWLVVLTGSEAKACTTQESQIAFEAAGFATAEDRLRLARMTDELRQLGLANQATSECRYRVILKLNAASSQRASLFDVDAQGFTLERSSKTVTITASHSIGALYGFYELIDQLGYRFPRPVEVIKPATIVWSAVPEKRDIKPRLAMRGFWIFGSNLDPEFLVWAGRNRFNLVGGDFRDESEIRKTFAIMKWSGGHNVVSRLTPTDRPVNGVHLVQAHPQWFGGGEATAVPYDSDTYRNPCFGDENYARYFAEQLITSLKTGELATADIINLWPSDLLLLTLPKSCKRAAGSKSDLDDLVSFYTVVTDRIASEKDWGNTRKRPVIAGISYQSDYDFGAATLKLPAKSNEAYIHLYYNSLRSHAQTFFDANASVNRQIAAEFQSSLRGQPGSALGIVEYHSYSIFQGMVAPELEVLKADLTAFQNNGSMMYAYMHPTRSPTMAEMLLNRALSRLSFVDEPVEAIRRDFDLHVLGGLAPAREAVSDYVTALKERANFFGPDFSLNLYNFNDHAWIPPILSYSAARAASLALLEGKKAALPPLRFSKLKPVEIEGPSLVAVIARLEMAREKADRAVLMANDPMLRDRLVAMSAEFARTLGVHKSLLYSSQALQAGYDADAERCQNLVKTALAHLPSVLAAPWPEYLSTMNMKRSFSSAQTHYLTYLQSKGCHSAAKKE